MASSSSSSGSSIKCVPVTSYEEKDDEETETDEDIRETRDESKEEEKDDGPAAMDEEEEEEEEEEVKGSSEAKHGFPTLERIFFPESLPECDERLLGAFPDCDPRHESVSSLAVVEWMMCTASMEQLMNFTRRRKVALKKLMETSPPVLFSETFRQLGLVPYVYQALLSSVHEDDLKQLASWGMVSGDSGTNPEGKGSRTCFKQGASCRMDHLHQGRSEARTKQGDEDIGSDGNCQHDR